MRSQPEWSTHPQVWDVALIQLLAHGLLGLTLAVHVHVGVHDEDAANPKVLWRAYGEGEDDREEDVLGPVGPLAMLWLALQSKQPAL